MIIGALGQGEYHNETTIPMGVVIQKTSETRESQISHMKGDIEWKKDPNYPSII